MKSFLWNVALTAAWMLVVSTMMFTLIYSPLGIAVWDGTAGWRQIVFFALVLMSPAMIAVELLNSRTRR